MSTPNVPVGFEFSVELPFPPEQVWQAIATGPGLTAWSMPTELEEQAGGEFVVNMGDTSSRGVVATWEPPHRLVLEEPEWAALTGHEGAEVTPLVTEYLVEATSGGSCVLRIVSSAFGSGADWEREFMDDAVKYWQPQFENLRVYLTTFPGQRATVVESGAELSSDPADVLTAMCDRFGATTIGDSIDVHGIAGRVEKITALGVLVRYTEPECGFLNLMAYPNGESTATPSPACTCSATVPPSWLPPKKQGGRNGSPSCRRPSAPTRCTRPVSFATRGGWHSHLTSARRVAPIAWRGSPRSTLGGLP